jgi:putative oxidoreductase
MVAGFDFALHGFQKALGWFGGANGHGGHAGGLLLWAGYIEMIAGILIVLGLLTRPCAFIASGEMAVAYFKVHAPRAFLPLVNRGELALLFCFIFLFLAAAGPGAWSLDRLLFRSSTRSGPESG